MKERLLDGRQWKTKIQSSGKMRQSICERIKTHSSLAGNQLLLSQIWKRKRRRTWNKGDVEGELKYAACTQTLFPLWRFYWLAQRNWETTFCCSPSQKCFLETLGYGKRVWNCGTWSVIEGYPNETWVWEQPSPTILMSQKTWSKWSPQHKTLP